MSTDRQRGLTIIELVMFMVIMGVAAAGIIGVLNLGTTSSADPLRRKQALMIAEAYMEEVQQAPFTFCTADDPNVGTATGTADCLPGNAVVAIGRPANAARPYGHVAAYAAAADTPDRAFANNGVDVDVNGRPMGQDQAGNRVGNNSLAGITTTVTLSLLGNGQVLGPAAGPANLRIQPAANALEVLRITIDTTYGPGQVIRLEGFRTRYAPRN
nr:type II secretion system protein [uncultured Duganella sp.]